jgi:DivIVA domain-containing protein
LAWKLILAKGNLHMELTSSVLRDVEFRETWKGYNQADVDTFIDEVALGVDALHSRIRELTESSIRAQQQMIAAPAAPTDDAVKRTVNLAQRAADLVVSEAKSVATRTVADAQAQAEKIVAEANSAASRQLAETEAESARMLANQVTAAQNTHAERSRQLEAERATLERETANQRAELDQLRSIVQSTRDRVRSALSEHLVRIDSLPDTLP